MPTVIHCICTRPEIVPTGARFVLLVYEPHSDIRMNLRLPFTLAASGILTRLQVAQPATDAHQEDQKRKGPDRASHVRVTWI